ncbi:MAG: Futalosine hydrolase [Gaiellaceae bacterium]|nr:MAG: Futalosine hydrolase [Gaiellaceae bacterium]
MTLLIAATEAELCGQPGLVCGVGPVEAAATTARALAIAPPAAALHVGLAGGSGLEPGTIVLGTESVFVDLHAAIPVVSRVVADASLLAALRDALPDALALPIATSAAVGRLRGSEPRGTGTSGNAPVDESTLVSGAEPASLRVEGMEGFAVLRACALAGVPAVEVRAISNELGEADRSRWEIPRALEALGAALRRMLAALPK